MGNTCCTGGDKVDAEVLVDKANKDNAFAPDLSEAKYEEKTYPVGTYKGQMLNGQRCGEGICEYNSGPSYRGQWWLDKCHGEGVFTDPESSYRGQWYAGKKHGFGEEVWMDDGTKYIGDHFHGNKHGKGKYIWKDGSTYEGDFSEDVVQGEGILRDADGGIYIGQFVDNMQHGFGKYTFQDTVYEGGWEETLKHGLGKLEDKVCIYEGTFVENEMHGTGVETDKATGKKMKVQYSRGTRV